MQTISPLPVDIDFDEASMAWMANKKRMGNGMYKYVCCAMTKTGKRCSRKNMKDSDHCVVHQELQPKPVAKPPGILTRIRYMFFGRSTLIVNPILDLKNMTITIHCDPPPLVCSFNDLTKMMLFYRNIHNISTIERIDEARVDRESVLVFLQFVMSFLNGLDELTKMQTKLYKVSELKAQLVQFMGYTGIDCIHCTSSQWAKISDKLKSDLSRIMVLVFDSLPAV